MSDDVETYKAPITCTGCGHEYEAEIPVGKTVFNHFNVDPPYPDECTCPECGCNPVVDND